MIENKQKKTLSPAPENQEQITQACIVLLAYKDTEDTMQKMWEKYCEVTTKTIIINEETTLKETLPSLVVDKDITDDFVLVLPNCIPCAKTDIEELKTPLFYVDKQGNEHFYYRLPIFFNKHNLLEFLKEEKNANLDNEEFAKEYIKTYSTRRALAVSHNFGNFLFYARTANCCQHKQIEALLRKKFIISTKEGFKSIEPFIVQNILK